MPTDNILARKRAAVAGKRRKPYLSESSWELLLLLPPPSLEMLNLEPNHRRLTYYGKGKLKVTSIPKYRRDRLGREDLPVYFRKYSKRFGSNLWTTSRRFAVPLTQGKVKPYHSSNIPLTFCVSCWRPYVDTPRAAARGQCSRVRSKTDFCKSF